MLDTNIIVYAAKPNYSQLRNWLQTQTYAVSELSRLEVMGYHRLTEKDIEYFSNFFLSSFLLPISNKIIDTAILFRRNYIMSLGDSIISATALIYSHKLCTNNHKDFKKVDHLELIDISNFL
ncbi:MAG: type II toxin-antitoxin system VapC family toxin [Balneolales bacterium]